MPRVEEVAPRRLSRAEIDQVLRSVPEEHGFIIRLAVATGLRWGEVRRLQWRHVDWNSRQLVIERTKSGKVRRVPVSEETLDMLRQQFADSKSMFVSPFRKKDSGAFLHFVKRKSGLKTFGFHKLRHAFACEWLEAGGSKEALQKILGHSTIRLTERYGQVSDDYVLKELETVAQTVAHRQEEARSTAGAVRVTP
jgi:integrase